MICRENNLKHGRGDYTSSTGDHYVGDFVNGVREGHGVFTWRSGKRYEGEFKNDQKHGHGVLIEVHGKRFEGEFLFDTYKGRGAHLPGGAKYVANLVDVAVKSPPKPGALKEKKRDSLLERLLI